MAGTDALDGRVVRAATGLNGPGVTRVSVVLPVRNGVPYLREAIASILAQTFSDFELVVSDNHSVDGTDALLSSFTDHQRLRLVRPPEPLSMSASHRFVIEQTTSEFVALMHADDVAEPHRLARQVAAMDSDPALVVVGSWAEVINPGGKHIGVVHHPVTPQQIAWEIRRRNVFVFPSVLIRRAAYDQVGGIRDDCGVGFDYDLFLHMLREGRGANIPEHLLRYRFHPEMDSLRSVKALRWGTMRARRQALRRDRQPAWNYLWLAPSLAAAILPAWLLRALAVPRIRVFHGRTRSLTTSRIVPNGDVPRRVDR